jgi:ribonuclease HI
MKSKKDNSIEIIRIFTDGSGCRPDGKGSGYAWIRPDTGQKKIVREDGLTNNQAEYKAILAAMDALPKQSKAEILTDSENTCFQLKGTRRVLDPKLLDLHSEIQNIVGKNDLSVCFTWIPRRENLAGKLL